jgi:hypothetical protein
MPWEQGDTLGNAIFFLLMHGLIFSFMGDGMWDRKTGEPSWRMESLAPWLIGAIVVCTVIGAITAPILGWMFATMAVPFILGAWNCNRPATIAGHRADIQEKAQKEERARIEKQQQAYLQALRPVHDSSGEALTGPAKEIAAHLHDLLKK